jgi:hypothetical protein
MSSSYGKVLGSLGVMVLMLLSVCYMTLSLGKSLVAHQKGDFGPPRSSNPPRSSVVLKTASFLTDPSRIVFSKDPLDETDMSVFQGAQMMLVLRDIAPSSLTQALNAQFALGTGDTLYVEVAQSTGDTMTVLVDPARYGSPPISKGDSVSIFAITAWTPQ